MTTPGLRLHPSIAARRPCASIILVGVIGARRAWLLSTMAAAFAIMPPALPLDAVLSKQADDAGCNLNRFRVVLDVGHSIDAPGARSARGIPEYQFNLLLAEQV